EGARLEPRRELVLVELGKDELPCRRSVQWHVDAYPVRDADVPVRVELQQDLHARAAVRNREQRGFARLVAQPCEGGTRGIDGSSVGAGGARERDELVTEHPAGPVRPLLDEPRVGKRVQRPRDGRARQPHDAAELGRGRPGGPVRNRLHDLDRTRQRLRPGRSSSAHDMSTLAHTVVAWHDPPMLVDCDIHVGYETLADLLPYLDPPTRELVVASGTNGLAMPSYPWNHPTGWFRHDVYERTAEHDANFAYLSLDVLRERHLDVYDVTLGIVEPDEAAAFSVIPNAQL